MQSLRHVGPGSVYAFNLTLSLFFLPQCTVSKSNLGVVALQHLSPNVLYYTSKHSMSSLPSEKDDIHSSARLEAQRSNDSSQPGMPIYHRRLANPAPLGLLSFATSVFLVSLAGMGTRGVEAPNIIITTMIFFGGICQYIAGIMEFVTGNTVSPLLVPLPSCATLMTGSIAGSDSLLFICWLQRRLRPYLRTRHWRVGRVHRRSNWQTVAGARSGISATHMGLVSPKRHIHYCCDAGIVVALAGTAVLRSRASAARCWLHRGK